MRWRPGSSMTRDFPRRAPIRLESRASTAVSWASRRTAGWPSAYRLPPNRPLFNEQNLGASLDRSLGSFGKRVPLDDVRFFSSAVLLQRQTGGNLGEVLGRLSHIIRERFRLKGQVKATSAHGRLTATILTVLPLATLAGLIITSPGYLSPLLTEPLGRKLVVAGVICQILGNIVIRRIIRIRV